MREYGNFYSREDVDIPIGNYIARGVELAKSRLTIWGKHSTVKYYVKTLTHEAKERNQMKMSVDRIAADLYVFYTYFNYNERIYYWWEMFKHESFSSVEDRIKKFDEGLSDGLDIVWSVGELYHESGFVKSALEIPVHNAPLVTYVWFATDEKQSPLMCTEIFKSKIVNL